MKIGQVIKNKGGQFGKVIAHSAGLFHIAGWFTKKASADKAKQPNFVLNSYGIASATGLDRAECVLDATASEAADTGVENAPEPNTDEEVINDDLVIEKGDVLDGDEAGDSDEVEEVETEALTVPQLQAILDDNKVEYKKSAKKPELVELVKGLGEVEA